jgi:hypothetical protein
MLKRVLLAVFCLAVTAAGQEGHPLTGTWIGDWGSHAAQRNHITLVMSWDGDKVTGVINPGPDSAPLQSVFVDLSNWTVRLEAETKDSAGKPVRIAAEGKIEELGSPKRRLTGTWRQGEQTGDFKVTRE